MDIDPSPAPAPARRRKSGRPGEGPSIVGGKRCAAGTPGSRIKPTKTVRHELNDEDRQRAADRLRKDLSATMEPQPRVLNEEQLKGVLDTALKLAADNAITEDNAFDLDFIDVLPNLVYRERRGTTLEEGGLGLDVGTRIYSKRVDHTYKLANNQLMGLNTRKKAGDADARQDDQDSENGEGRPGTGDDGDAEGEEGGAAAGGREQEGKAKGRKPAPAHNANVSSTLADEESLAQKPAEQTFESDPFFRKTAMLFDESCPSSLLLLNMSVYDSSEVLFDSAAKPLRKAMPTDATAQGQQAHALDRWPVPASQWQPIVAALPAAAALAAAARSGCLQPGVGALYGQLTGGQLEAAQAARPPEVLLRAALEAHRLQVEDGGTDTQAAAEVAAAVAAAPTQSNTTMHTGQEDFGGGQRAGHHHYQHDDDAGDDDVAWGGVGDTGADADDVHGGHMGDEESFYDAGGEEESMSGMMSGAAAGTAAAAAAGAHARGVRQSQPQPLQGEESYGGGGVDPDQDEYDEMSFGGAPTESEGVSALAANLQQLLGNNSGAGGAGVAGNAWAGGAFWKAIRRPPTNKKGTAAAALRREKPPPQVLDLTQLDLTADPPSPASVCVGQAKALCFKQRRKKKVELLPKDHGVQEDDLFRTFCGAPPGQGQGQRGGGGVSLREAWKATLLEQRAAEAAAAEAARAQAQQRQQQPAQGGGDGDGGWGGDDDDVVGGGGGGGYGDGMDGDDYDGGAFHGDADAGGGGGGGGGDAGLGGGGGGGGGGVDLSLEELLEPPKRVERIQVNYATRVKVVDVRGLKHSLLSSLSELHPSATGATPAPSAAPSDKLITTLSQQPAPGGASSTRGAKAAVPVEQQVLPFQALVDDLPKHTGGGAAALQDVSVHLCFICLLHLANEHGLALTNGGDLGTLHIAAGSGGHVPRELQH